ncbi:MAG TPA: hypothetical protein VLT92_11605 [Burkholderiales bacterium]|nr:hypothetical protein [Burkholderiales bacterium]
MWELISFARRHLIPIGGIAIAVLTWAYGVVSGAHEIATALLAPWQWQLVGGAVFIVCILSMLFHWDRRQNSEKQGEEKREMLGTEPPSSSEVPQTYEGAHQRLLDFVIDHLLPTIHKMEAVRANLTAALSSNYLIAEYAVSGLRHDHYVAGLTEAIDDLEGPLGTSPISFIPFEEMAESVLRIEIDYHLMMAQAEKVRKTGTLSDRSNQHLGGVWREWRDSHNAMIDAYERIRRDTQMGKLFRPMRPARFGVPMQVTDNGLPQYLNLQMPH